VQVLGRLASRIAVVLQGKDKPTYSPHEDKGDMCVVVNAKDVTLTGNKLTDKKYYWHTGYADACQSFFNLEPDKCKFDSLLMVN